MIWSFLQVTKEKFKTKATETFARVVQGAKKGVVKARGVRCYATTGLSVVAIESSRRKLTLFTFFFATSKLAVFSLGSLEESSRFASQLGPWRLHEDAGRG